MPNFETINSTEHLALLRVRLVNQLSFIAEWVRESSKEIGGVQLEHLHGMALYLRHHRFTQPYVNGRVNFLGKEYTFPPFLNAETRQDMVNAIDDWIEFVAAPGGFAKSPALHAILTHYKSDIRAALDFVPRQSDEFVF